MSLKTHDAHYAESKSPFQISLPFHKIDLVSTVCDLSPAVVFSYLASSLAAMLAALSYSEFAAELPVAGGAFNYISMVFGEFFAW